jgi:hypothetical protein
VIAMAVFRLVFSDEDFEARKAMFFGDVRESGNVWVWADNEVQVALTFPEATIRRHGAWNLWKSFNEVNDSMRLFINYIIE